MHNFLLVDISNSFTKLALSHGARLGQRARLPTRELTAARLKRAIAGWQFERVIVSSVVPERSGVVAAASGRPVLEIGPALDLGVGIDYPNPRSIGADRLANAAGAFALHGAPAVVVDFGTAVTFDILSAAGAYIGGVIAPGLAAMTTYLHDQTALLPRISLAEPESAVGRSTREAMLSGAVHGYRGLVEGILREVKREIAPRGRMRVVATGGYAALIAEKLPAIQKVDPDLTFHGLRIIGERNPGAGG